MSKKTKRFQECGIFEKLWRLRRYLLVPYWAFRTYIKTPEFVDYRFKNSWRLAVGSAQCEMNWVYTMDEVMEHLEARRNKNK